MITGKSKLEYVLNLGPETILKFPFTMFRKNSVEFCRAALMYSRYSDKDKTLYLFLF